ncbi:hypothetical protein [Cardinium endosymbiont of Bemisia tabaci]|uniref:hypothetical protein n=1 Tax=Cardinium endosymbiont of Bemisia tabaci TaxID=672794 RepID=UPI001030710D|nr:hypothetical protein [Cardinium endosymbiont of Bemisia tabaci]
MFLSTTTVAYAGQTWDKIKDFGESALDYVPFGSTVKKLFGKQDKQVDLLKTIAKTEKSTFEKIKDTAKTAMETKRAIEKANRKVRDAIKLGSRLKNIDFKKMIVGQTEDVLGISLNPASYIPDTQYTAKLTRNMQYSCAREKQTIRGVNRFLKNTGKLVGIKATNGKYTDLQKLNKAVEKSIHYDRTVGEYAHTKQLLLADAYEREADELLSNNKEIQHLLDEDAAHLKVNERLAAYNLLQQNIIRSTKLKEKAVKLS